MSRGFEMSREKGDYGDYGDYGDKQFSPCPRVQVSAFSEILTHLLFRLRGPLPTGVIPPLHGPAERRNDHVPEVPLRLRGGQVQGHQARRQLRLREGPLQGGAARA